MISCCGNDLSLLNYQLPYLSKILNPEISKRLEDRPTTINFIFNLFLIDLRRFGGDNKDKRHLAQKNTSLSLHLLRSMARRLTMTAYYDTIAKEYQQSKYLPYRLHIEAYTYFYLLGDLVEKSILDLGCGEGFYTRKFKQRGAARVVGVDISSKMIFLAKQQQAKEPLGIEYIIADAEKLGKIGSFDLVVASYLLNYARTKEQLLRMCQTISANLKPGCRFVSVNDNSEQPPESYLRFKKYGFVKSISQPLREGTPITYTMSANNQTFRFDNYYLSRTTYESVFRAVGFQKIHWQQPVVSPLGVQEFGQEFWKIFSTIRR